MKIHVLNGFLGSGKTTAIRQACIGLMRDNIKVGVITNDQGIKLVDGGFFRSLQIPSRQVVSGCFCCNYNQFNTNMESLIETNKPDVIFAESVGSCTDIVATVLKPLQSFHPSFELSFSVFADARLLLMLLKGNFSMFDESVNYIYKKQLEEATIIVINKIDLLSIEEDEEIKHLMDEKFQDKKLLFQNSTDPGSIRDWLEALNQNQFDKSSDSLTLNYDIYGAGEAKLAWVDEEITIRSSSRNALSDGGDLIKNIYERIKAFGYPVGHLKFLLNGDQKFSFTSIVEPSAVKVIVKPADTVILLVNARVQTDLDELSRIIADAIEETTRWSGCRITINSLDAFQPGYPKPTHRMS
ncbi:MAG: hypothetical protein JST75_04195 [Bacteroidetes bacterium]|nr:hypothetical protein [Bacteroidota bacterium]